MDERDTTAVIDRALELGAATATDPIERELEQLALTLADDRPTPDAAFTAALDERVRQGFPRMRGSETHPANPLRRLQEALAGLTVKRPPMALLGGVASLLLVLTIVVSLSGGNGDEPGGGSTAALEEPQSSPDAGGGSAASDGGAADIPSGAIELRHDGATGKAQRSLLAVPRTPRARGFAPGTRDRRIQRSASLTLATPGDELDRVAADITRVTERYRGYVLSSSLATGDEGVTTGGNFELRVPSARLQPALADLAKLGQVRARTQAGDDVTAAFVTTGDRLEAARAERRNLLQRLENADTDVEAESLRLQLDANAGEINRLRDRIRRLRISTDYANVSVALEARDGEASAPGDGLGGALDDALDSLGDSLELAIRAVGVLVPLALLATVLALASRAIVRRRRESALS
jgi:hypothetical protein